MAGTRELQGVMKCEEGDEDIKLVYVCARVNAYDSFCPLSHVARDVDFHSHRRRRAGSGPVGDHAFV